MFDWITTPIAASGLRAVLLFVGGWLAARLVSVSLVRALRRYTAAQSSMVLRRASFWLVFGIATVMALRQLGFDLSVLLGAAGIVTVALGFASQTSASNLISGLFLIGERPFVVGDVIKVGTTTGEVLSIDLLSVKLRTFDNLLVRVPNETLIKSEITNFTRFPIRRLDMQIGVAYKDDIEQVREVLMEVADRNPLCLVEPKPLFIFLGFGDSAINLQFSVWAQKEKFLDLRNSIHMEVKQAFEQRGIEIPFPQRVMVAGHEPIRVVVAGDNGG